MVFRILRLIRSQHLPYLEESRLLKTLSREEKEEYSEETVHEQLDYMLQQHLLKPVRTEGNRMAYALDWPGHDYLDAV